MTLGLAGAVLSILTTWVILFIAFAGIGLLIRSLFDGESFSSHTLLAAFWLGFSLTVLFLQIWHFFAPINAYALLIVALFGLMGIRSRIDAIRSWLRKRFISEIRVETVALLLLSIWVANRAMGPCTAVDSAMYHIPVISWAKSLPIVPGLGNLHDRLAFNNSSLLYAAMLEVGPWSPRSNHLANGLLNGPDCGALSGRLRWRHQTKTSGPVRSFSSGTGHGLGLRSQVRIESYCRCSRGHCNLFRFVDSLPIVD